MNKLDKVVEWLGKQGYLCMQTCGGIPKINDFGGRIRFHKAISPHGAKAHFDFQHLFFVKYIEFEYSNNHVEYLCAPWIEPIMVSTRDEANEVSKALKDVKLDLKELKEYLGK